eukprot:scaffold246069_cov32-Tisochrysis_lutea.AAC.4
MTGGAADALIVVGGLSEVDAKIGITGLRPRRVRAQPRWERGAALFDHGVRALIQLAAHDCAVVRKVLKLQLLRDDLVLDLAHAELLALAHRELVHLCRLGVIPLEGREHHADESVVLSLRGRHAAALAHLLDAMEELG